MGWPLRTKLIASMVALLAVVCAIIGVVSELALSAFLIRQVDAQLVSASNRAKVFLGKPRGLGPPPDPLNAPGQASGTLTARLSGGRVVDAGMLTAQGQPQELDAAAKAALLGLPVDGRPYTRALGGLGDYRLIAENTPDDVVVTGLPLAQVDETLLTVGLILARVTLAGVLGAGFAGACAVRRTLRPLDRVAAVAARVTELPLDRGEVALSVRVADVDTDPRTEVGQVGAALNRMLGHVGDALRARHAGEQRARQFVADASHELRTPLAAIRGYAELIRRGRESLPPGVAHAMDRVDSESARMASLVEGLLLLARLDAGRPLEIGEADLSRLVADAVGDARIAGPRHRWLVELPPEPVLVRGDVQRLHQIVANLLSNGRTHTPPGTTITAALARSAGGEVVLTVTDDGPGIPADLLPTVFERFVRGDSSRSRGAGSTGLGMAIVAALVSAHRGSVAVHSVPGRTEFEVRLPAARATHRNTTTAA
ncbi:sensor histidine kinase [Amycolatopsis anabasis]|uniref:sensor histidine kinase n=1 Tax=Amycolatopsis anabasis TaxID=1840409 RepID=UPI00131DA7CB|nr:HAMP domain-containing sensor histidine kinase [Amycolatopsis anabasis]